MTKSLKNITDNFWNYIINNEKAASIFIDSYFFQSILVKILLRDDLHHTFCWLIVNTEVLSIPEIMFDITFLEPFHFCSFLSFFLNFGCLNEKSTWFSSEISFGDFEQIWKHFPDYQMKTNLWRNQLQWTLSNYSLQWTLTTEQLQMTT